MSGEEVDDARLRTLLRAFGDDGIARWLLPDPASRPALYREWFGMVLEHAEREGSVLTGEDGDAVQVWLSALHGPAEMLDEAGGRRLLEIAGAAAPRFREFGELTSANHPDEPHQYLALIAVDPAVQASGIGTRELTAALRRWDAEGVATYLEASTPRSRRLYARLGFRDRGAPIELPGGPSLYPMWREPNPA
ncbi:GNAT family N-acetyltransferase [Saccharopolyspora erythraea]|uniref:GNAT family N-acetyltransferase n=1 Tax=Saccharopolyspora erythraea TaxID=1836 RepID=UPI001BA629D0|nr:GNAT family N-acetyltransferase [Saccharopolyspora erythraea]QUH03033.1 GNAT family N-acetyltransferase [Saccharopolyspora erythraea]